MGRGHDAYIITRFSTDILLIYAERNSIALCKPLERYLVELVEIPTPVLYARIKMYVLAMLASAYEY